jgi:2-methylcitrate dehydratase PrpD
MSGSGFVRVDEVLTDSVRDVLVWLFDPPALDNLAGFEPDVERAARLLFLDTLGCTIGGGGKPELRALNTMLATLETGTIGVPGMTEGLTAPAAAYWCAMAATWDEACEGLARAHGRPGLHAFPVALTLTLARGGSLGQALIALIRGYEVAGRLGERFRIREGMHVDGTWGTFGAVAAAGSVLGHEANTVLATIEAAACQIPFSLYLPISRGATVRNSYVANSCQRAIALSLSVAAGVTAPSGALQEFDDLALEAAGTGTAIALPGEWLITQGYLKPFAAVRHVHYGAEAARRWRGQGTPTSAIDRITLDVYPEAVTYCGNRAPQTAIEAQFSLTYGIAHMLHTGDLGPEAYTAIALTDPEIRRLEQLIDVRSPSGRSPDQRYATLRIRTTAGNEETINVNRVIGDPDHAMSTKDVTAKFLRYSDHLLTNSSAEAIASAIVDGPLNTPLSDIIQGSERSA